MRARFGPLQEIPLDHERLRIAEDGHSLAMSSVLSKRPPSPSKLLCSPLKKRLLLDEGTPNHKGSSTRTPTTHRDDTRGSGFLHGSRSPARKLDFSAMTPDRKTTVGIENVALIPESPPRSKNNSSRSPIAAPALLPSFYDPSSDPMASRTLSTKLVTRLVSGDCAVDVEMTDSSRPSVTVAFEKVCRAVHEPDRSSVHYPGFDIYQDPFDYIYDTARIRARTSLSCSSDEELNKENVRLIRPLKSHIGATAWAKAGLSSPGSILLASPSRSSSDEWADESSLEVATPRAQRRIRDIGNIAVSQKRTSAPRVPLVFTSASFALLDRLGEAEEPAKARPMGEEEYERAELEEGSMRGVQEEA